MAFSYLNEDNLSDKYSDSKKYTELLTAPFQEFERISANRPSDQRDPRYSDVTDGTTASITRKVGKRVVQQIPTGKVEADDDDNNWLPIVAGFIFLNKILPYANHEYDFIQKCWQIIERGAQFGGVPTYVPFLNHDGEYSPDLTLPYWADVFIPRGYKSAAAAPYLFLRTWLQEDDIDSLIDQEKRMRKQARRRDERYESTWDLDGLKAIKKSCSSKKSNEQQPHERDRGTNSEGIEAVTGFQVGVGATFYTFCPTTGDDKSDKDFTIIRRKQNKDPRGKIPMPWFIYDTDGFNPLGRGIVELIGPLQNLIDDDMSMYQWNRALMLAPPIAAYGASKKKIVYAPNAVISMNRDDKIEPLDVSTTAIEKYPDLYGLQKSQLLNLTNSPDTSISAEVGNPGFGKTPQALQQQQAAISVDDNYVRKNFEAWFENWAETAINLYFAERTGKEELQLDNDTADELRQLAEKGKFDLSQLSDDNRVIIDYDTATPALKFRVDASTSKMKDDVTQGEILTQLLQTLEANPILIQLVPQDKVLSAWNRIVTSSGVENPEELTVDIKELKEQQEAAAIQQQEMASAQQQGAQEPASEEEQIAQYLQSMGVPDEQINEALQMAEAGYSADDILTAIQGVMANARG